MTGGRHDGPDAGAIAAMLAGRMAALAADLLPAGRKVGHEWCVGDVSGAPGMSCKIVIEGAKRGVWQDFASGQKGDALDLVRDCLDTDMRGALAWARGWLGIDAAAPSSERRSPAAAAPAPSASGEPALEEARRIQLARDIWQRARPVEGTAAEGYLRARGIRCAVPPTLRFYPTFRHGPSGLFFPCLIAAVADVERRITGVWRIWLAQDEAGQWGKAPVVPVKMGLGRARGCAVRLTPLQQRLAVAEGIETALSIAQACPDMAVWAALCTSGLRSLDLPFEVTDVTLCIDGDAAGRAAAEAAAERFQREGRAVRIADPGEGRDFNDILRVA